MPSIYDVDYKIVNNNILAPQYRQSKIKAFVNAMIYPIQWLRDRFFLNYVESYQDYIIYSGGSSVLLNQYELVKFPDNSVWENQVSNIDIATYNPTLGQLYSGSTLLWVKIQEDFIGLNERLKYSNQKIMLEYILNRYFNDSLDTIYISNNNTSIAPFYICDDDTDIDCGYVGFDEDNCTEYISFDDTLTTVYHFTIFIPDTLVSIDLDEIRVIVDRYNYYSLTYNFQIYTP